MRITLDLDPNVLEAVLKLTCEKTKNKAVNKALEEYSRDRRIQELRAMLGTIDLVDNWRELRELDLKRQEKLKDMGW